MFYGLRKRGTSLRGRDRRLLVIPVTAFGIDRAWEYDHLGTANRWAEAAFELGFIHVLVDITAEQLIEQNGLIKVVKFNHKFRYHYNRATRLVNVSAVTWDLGFSTERLRTYPLRGED